MCLPTASIFFILFYNFFIRCFLMNFFLFYFLMNFSSLFLLSKTNLSDRMGDLKQKPKGLEESSTRSYGRVSRVARRTKNLDDLLDKVDGDTHTSSHTSTQVSSDGRVTTTTTTTSSSSRTSRTQKSMLWEQWFARKETKYLYFIFFFFFF